MSVTINLSSNGRLANLMSNTNMMKSTQDKLNRQAERDNKVAFFEAQKENLKNMKSLDMEDIAKKLELFHSYEDSIAAAKQEYNNSQMFHSLDEARERGEKLAKAAEKNKPKTEDERKKDAIEEVSGDETGDGMLSEMMDSIDAVQEKQLEEMESKKDEIDAADAETSQLEKLQDGAEMQYRPFDVKI